MTTPEKIRDTYEKDLLSGQGVPSVARPFESPRTRSSDSEHGRAARRQDPWPTELLDRDLLFFLQPVSVI